MTAHRGHPRRGAQVDGPPSPHVPSSRRSARRSWRPHDLAAHRPRAQSNPTANTWGASFSLASTPLETSPPSTQEKTASLRRPPLKTPTASTHAATLNKRRRATASTSSNDTASSRAPTPTCAWTATKTKNASTATRAPYDPARLTHQATSCSTHVRRAPTRKAAPHATPPHASASTAIKPSALVETSALKRLALKAGSATTPPAGSARRQGQTTAPRRGATCGLAPHVTAARTASAATPTSTHTLSAGSPLVAPS